MRCTFNTCNVGDVADYPVNTTVIAHACHKVLQIVIKDMEDKLKKSKLLLEIQYCLSSNENKIKKCSECVVGRVNSK